MRRLLILMAAGLAACTPQDPEELELATQLQAMYERTELRMKNDDPADLRPEARAILEHLHKYGGGNDLPLPGEMTQLAFTNPPKTIKLWRRSKLANPKAGKSCDPGNVIQVIPMEQYVKGVLPHEWIYSWHSESLKAGAVAIRTYASYFVSKGGKYTCADLCDTTYSQVYKDANKPKTNQAVDDTKGQLMIKNNKLVSTEYSDKNTQYPTWGGKTVNDTTTCAGESKYGHGRGMCQWGSSRWAAKQGKGYSWIVHHYYPGATLWTPGATQPDKGVPPKKDTGTPPKKDTGTPPKKDKGTPPKKDKGTPPPRLDGALPPSYQHNAYTLRGGCSAGGPGAGGTLALCLLLLLAIRRRG